MAGPAARASFASMSKQVRESSLKWSSLILWWRKWWFKLTLLPVGAVVVGLVTVVPPVKHWVSAPDLTLQGVDVYTVEVAPEVYQVGLVAQIANLNSSAHLLSEVSFESLSLDSAARGASILSEIHQPVAKASVMESNLLKPNDVAFVKLLLPMRLHMRIKFPPPPEYVLWGKWVVRVKKGFFSRERTKAEAEFLGNAESVISYSQWLSTPASVLGSSVRRKPFPRNFPRTNSYKTFLVFNPDSSAALDIYGFDQTNEARSSAGVMMFLIGTMDPPLPLGWRILGPTYPAVWADSQTLAIYNSVCSHHPLCSPDEKGNPRPFGVFAGREHEMGAAVSVPTTRGRDIVNIRLMDPSEYDPKNPVYYKFTSSGTFTREREQVRRQ